MQSSQGCAYRSKKSEQNVVFPLPATACIKYFALKARRYACCILYVNIFLPLFIICFCLSIDMLNEMLFTLLFFLQFSNIYTSQLLFILDFSVSLKLSKSCFSTYMLSVFCRSCKISSILIRLEMFNPHIIFSKNMFVCLSHSNFENL